MIIVDTHALVWWKNSPQKLGRDAARELENAAEVGVCPISCWELAMLVAKQRLRLDRDVLVWLKQALAQPTTRLLPLLPEIAVLSTRLGEGLLSDPADRLIAATAIHFRCRLVTADQRLQAFPEVQSVW